MTRVEKLLAAFSGVVINTPLEFFIKVLMADNDGTFSTLRGAWKGIMEGYMMDVLTQCGQVPDTDANLAVMRQEVKNLIRETDGINTIEQMALFLELVAQWKLQGYAIEDRTDEQHKAAYVCRMQAAVLPKYESLLCSGTLSPSDVTVTGAIPFFRDFQAQGGMARIFSGTDDAFLKADLHTIAIVSGLHWENMFSAADGALLDRHRSSKDARMLEVFASSQFRSEDIAVVGDGPIELIVGKKNGCYAIGIAEDEERRAFLTRKVQEALGSTAIIDCFIPNFGDTEAERAALIEYLRPAA